ncbi:MAG: ABC transporter permease, partial [Cellulosilyticaceae bacterium]
MLGKLIKYEFKATGRTFLPLYGAILIVALVHRVLGRSSQELFEELNRVGDFATIALVALFMALGVITLIVTIQRFQKSLLSDEGYLMFTLPVKIRSLIASKMVVATTWVILSGIVGIISFVILFANKEFFAEFLPLLSEMITQMKEILQDESG